MPRPARRHTIIPGQYYHVYSRGNDGRQIFRDAADYEFYVGLVVSVFLAHGIHLYHFALMPNHIHLLLCPDGDRLSEAMKLVQNRYTKRFCKKYAFRGHLWQGRFKNKPIDSDAYLLACGNYIEMNPVRAGLANGPADWPYSSYGHYASGECQWPVESDPFYPGLGRTDEARQAAYRKLVGKARASG